MCLTVQPLEALREPRTWQRSAFDRWVENGHLGVVQVVTGGGKTIFATLCMAELDRRHPETARVVVLVPTLTLLDQWFVSLVEDTSVGSDEIATYSGEGIPTKPSRINLLVLNTARRMAPLISDEGDVLLVVDECHRAGSPENAKALQGRKRAALGLSATPDREYDSGFELRVMPHLGPIIYRYDYNDAVRDGVIVPFRLVNVEVSLANDEGAKYARASRRIARLQARHNKGENVADSLTLALINRARIANEARSRIPTAVRIVDNHKGQRCIVFHERIRDAEEIAALLRGRGHSVATYHSNLGPELRRDNLRLFRRGVFDVLVTCRALDEGLNVPEAEFAVIASGTASSRQRIQRIGRVLRPSSGKPNATVYTLYATEHEARRLLSEAQGLDLVDVTWMRAT